MKKMLVFSFISILLLSSCSNLGWGYRFSDNWLAWQIDDLFDLTGKQDDFVDNKLDKLKRWHKKNELPKYVAVLQNLKSKVKNREPVLVWTQEEIKVAQETLVDYMLEDTSTFLSGVSTNQWRNFQRFVVERANDQKTEGQDKTSVERWEDGLENWIGKLTPSQKRFIEQQFDFMPKNYQDLKRQHTLSVAENFQKAMQSGDKDFLKQWFMGELPSSIVEYDLVRQQRTESTQVILAHLLETLTSKQRKNLYEAIDDLSDSIEDIYR
jgi:hypothetical protein